ncbi:MAG: carbohydrate ABC transporter permease [Chloroflexi bacterium]|nr:carbohydrate ABC transporter permease [Chloroflexota bacterium]
MAERTLARPAHIVQAVPWWQRRSVRRKATTIVATIIALIGAVVVMIPFVWMISTSLKTKFTALQLPPQWIPRPPHWENYPDALTFLPFHLFFRNTFMYATLTAFGETLSCSLVAYGFARLRAPGKNVLFLIVLGTLMLPYQVTMIPQYVLFKILGWIDTWKPLIVPTFFGSAYLIFLLRQFYMSIHQDIVDAARIDGCSYFDIWWRIFAPLSRPALMTVAILSFMYHWNDYLGPLIYLSTTEKLPVSVGLANFTAAYGGTPWHWLMAASVTAVTPLIIIFFFMQRYFIQGIVITGVKG